MEYVPFGAADKIKLTIAIIQNIVAVPTKSGKTCSERDAMKFMMLCQAQRLNPFAGDAFLIGYDGQQGATFSLITAHQAFLKRAETSPDFDGMTSGILLRKDDDTIEEREGDFHLRDEAESVVGGWAKVFHKKRSHPTFRKIRMERFNKGFAQWKEDAAGMIVKCAEADALRSTFPTLLGGLYMKEEIEIGLKSSNPEVAAPDFTKKISEAGKNALMPEEKPEAGGDEETADEAKETSSQFVARMMTEGGVSFDDFRDAVKVSDPKLETDSWASYDEVPIGVADKLAADAKGLAKIIKTYGKK